MSDVFISYARNDREAARRLARSFETQGWSVFWDRAIPTGKTWSQVIGAALKDARCVVVLWSKHSIESDWVLEEAEQGRQRGILIPVLIETVTPPLGFGRIQAADLSGWKGDHGDPALNQLLQDIATRLGKTPATIVKRNDKHRRRGLARTAFVAGGIAVVLFILWLIFGPPKDPPTADLTADPQEVVRGQSTIVSWNTKDADNVRIEPDIGPVSSTGSRELTPNRSVTYQLTAEGRGGTTVDSVFIKVTRPGGGDIRFAADFDVDPLNAQPTRPTVGTWTVPTTDAGTVLVRQIGGSKYVQLSQREGLTGGAGLVGVVNRPPDRGRYIASWRSMVESPTVCVAGVAVGSGNGEPLGSMAYRPGGQITLGSGTEPFPVRWRQGVWQLFEMHIDLDSGVIDYQVDGVPMQGFQGIAIFQGVPIPRAIDPIIQTISMNLGCMQNQSFAWDDIKVSRVP